MKFTFWMLISLLCPQTCTRLSKSSFNNSCTNRTLWGWYLLTWSIVCTQPTDKFEFLQIVVTDTWGIFYVSAYYYYTFLTNSLEVISLRRFFNTICSTPSTTFSFQQISKLKYHFAQIWRCSQPLMSPSRFYVQPRIKSKLLATN